MNIVEKISKESLRKGMPDFRPGDTVRVYCKIKEGEKERIQVFEGVCIRRRRGAAEASFTVRKMSYGVGVERVFPLYSPQIDRVEVVSAGKVRRSRLYYLRDLTGKKARIEGRQWKGKEELEIEEAATDEEATEAKGEKTEGVQAN